MKPKQLLYLVSNNKEACIISFPAAFTPPPKRENKGITYFKTDRIRLTPDGPATLYTEHPCTLDLDKFSIPAPSPETVPQEPMPQEPVFNTQEEVQNPQTVNNYVANATYGEDPNKVSYYAISCHGQYYTENPQLPTPTLFISEKAAKKVASKIPFYKEEGYDIVSFQDVGIKDSIAGK